MELSAERGKGGGDDVDGTENVGVELIAEIEFVLVFAGANYSCLVLDEHL